MPIYLGLDIGSNSVGSAWVDTDNELVDVGVTIFPAGVAETDTKRGAPLNQKRRQKRQQRKGIARRARRKLRLRRWLASNGFLPNDGRLQPGLRGGEWLCSRDNPWFLRRVALTESLNPHEFGCIVLHMAQRRGAVGLKSIERPSDVDEAETATESKENESADDAVLATARKHTRELMASYNATTYGELMWLLLKERQTNPISVDGQAKTDKTFQKQAVRNRHDLLLVAPDKAVYADRALVREEFLLIWQKQKELGGAVSKLLTDERLLALDDPHLKRFENAGNPGLVKSYLVLLS